MRRKHGLIYGCDEKRQHRSARFDFVFGEPREKRTDELADRTFYLVKVIHSKDSPFNKLKLSSTEKSKNAYFTILYLIEDITTHVSNAFSASLS